MSVLGEYFHPFTVDGFNVLLLLLKEYQTLQKRKIEGNSNQVRTLKQQPKIYSAESVTHYFTQRNYLQNTAYPSKKVAVRVQAGITKVALLVWNSLIHSFRWSHKLNLKLAKLHKNTFCRIASLNQQNKQFFSLFNKFCGHKILISHAIQMAPQYDISYCCNHRKYNTNGVKFQTLRTARI